MATKGYSDDASFSLDFTGGIAAGNTRNSNERPVQGAGDRLFHVKLEASGASSDDVFFYVLEGKTTGQLSDAGNRVFVGRVRLNGTNTVRKMLRVHDWPPLGILQIEAPSGIGLAATCSVSSQYGIWS